MSSPGLCPLGSFRVRVQETQKGGEHVNCPHCVNGQTSGAILLCDEAIEPFDFCTSERHRACPHEWNTSENLTLAIHREVTRAIG